MNVLHKYHYKHANLFINREFTKKRKDTEKNVKGRWMVKTSQGLWREAVKDENIVFEELTAPPVSQKTIPDLERKRRRDSSRGEAGENTAENKKEKSEV